SPIIMPHTVESSEQASEFRQLVFGGSKGLQVAVRESTDLPSRCMLLLAANEPAWDRSLESIDNDCCKSFSFLLPSTPPAPFPKANLHNPSNAIKKLGSFCKTTFWNREPQRSREFGFLEMRIIAGEKRSMPLVAPKGEAT